MTGKQMPALLLCGLLFVLLTGTSAAGDATSAPTPPPSQPSAELGLLSLSPDGQWLLVSARPRIADGRRWNPPIRLANIDCLKRLHQIEGCVEISDPSTRSARVIWSSDSQAILLMRNGSSDAGPVRFERTGAGWSAVRPTMGKPEAYNLPPVLAPSLLRAWPDMSGFERREAAWKDLAPATLKSLGPDEGPVFNAPDYDSVGRIAGWEADDAEGRDVVLDRTAIIWSLPTAVRRRMPGLPMPNWPSSRVYPNLTGGGIYVRSSEIGPEPGILEFRRRGVVRSLPLPPRPGSPLHVVFTPSVSMAVGVFSTDRFYGVEAPDAFSSDLNGYVLSARRRTSSLELMQVVVPDGLGVAALRFRDVAGADQLHIFDPTTGKGFQVLDVAEPDPESGLPFAVRANAIRIPSPAGDLPARLYRADRDSPARGLVMTFHGGPPVDTFSNGHEWTRALLALGFDVLDVDYRGSTGYGEAHLLALRAPISKPVGEDLGATLSWIWGRPEYADGLVGVQGTSFGGYFGVVAVQSGAPSIDFVILDSPLIDPHGQRREPCGTLSTLQVDIFGERALEDGDCTLGSTGAFNLPRYAPIPAFAIAGSRDAQTPAATTRRWAGIVNARGGCVTLVGVAGGRHTMPSFPAETRAELQSALALWLFDVKSGRAVATCGSRLDLAAARGD